MKLRIAMLLMLGLASSAGAETKVDVTSRENRQAALPVVEKALSAPMANLYAKARSGSALDDLTFGLALLTGRDNAAQVPQDKRELAEPAIQEMRKTAWQTLPELSEQPDEAEIASWAKEAELGFRQCTPCFVRYDPSPQYGETQWAVQIYAQATYPLYWLDLAANATSGNDAWTMYVPPVRKGEAGTFTDVPARQRPKLDKILLFNTRACVTQVIGSVKQEKALVWLKSDGETASGLRLALNKALSEYILKQAALTTGVMCADGQFERLKALLIESRPELDSLVAADLNLRLSDPRSKAGNSY